MLTRKDSEEKLFAKFGKLINMSRIVLTEEIKRKKETNKKRIKQFEEGNKKRVKQVKENNKNGLEALKKFLGNDLQEREEMLKELLETPQKRPITPKPIQNHSK